MKIKNLPGEFAFKALYRELGYGWKLSEWHFFSFEEVIKWINKHDIEVKWPVEVYDDGSLYCPTKEELE